MLIALFLLNLLLYLLYHVTVCIICAKYNFNTNCLQAGKQYPIYSRSLDRIPKLGLWGGRVDSHCYRHAHVSWFCQKQNVIN